MKHIIYIPLFLLVLIPTCLLGFIILPFDSRIKKYFTKKEITEHYKYFIS